MSEKLYYRLKDCPFTGVHDGYEEYFENGRWYGRCLSDKSFIASETEFGLKVGYIKTKMRTVQSALAGPEFYKSPAKELFAELIDLSVADHPDKNAAKRRAEIRKKLFLPNLADDDAKTLWLRHQTFLSEIKRLHAEEVSRQFKELINLEVW